MSENPCYVLDEASGNRFEEGSLQSCVSAARIRVKTFGGRFGVYRDNRYGDSVFFNVYPDADLQWDAYQRAGLVPRDVD